MTARTARFIAVLATGTAGGPLSADDTAPAADAAAALRFNPFQRPVLIATPQAAVQLDTRPVLRGVMLAGDDSMANIDGELYALGESKGDITVTRIDETGATIRRNGVDERLALVAPDTPAPQALASRDEQ